jgi:hypothetical protein
MAPQYKKLAKDLSKQVVFADFNARDNQGFCRNILDVQAYPTVLIYKAPNELLSTHPCGPSKVKKVKLALLTHVDEHFATMNMSENNQQAEEDDPMKSEEGVGRQMVSRLQGAWKAMF